MARSILLLMLPLESKITPSDTGASSLEKDLISSLELPSNSWKFSLSRPVTRRFMGSVMVTGTSTRSTATFRGRTWVFREAGTTVPSATSSVLVFSTSWGVAGRGITWTSFTSACPAARKVKVHATPSATNSIQRKSRETLLFGCNRTKLGFQGRTRWDFRNRVLGRRAISTSIGSDSITALLRRPRFFCQIFVTIRKWAAGRTISGSS